MRDYFIFLWLSFIVTYTPGPSILLIVSQGVRLGFIASLPTMLGNLSASILYGIISITTIGPLLSSNQKLVQVIAMVGSLYLIVMGFTFIIKGKDEPIKSMESITQRQGPMKDYLIGFMSNISNPKIMLFYLLVIPQFNIYPKNFILSLMILVITQNLMKASSLVFYTALAQKVRNWLNNIKSSTIQKFSGLSLIIAGIALAIENLNFQVN